MFRKLLSSHRRARGSATTQASSSQDASVSLGGTRETVPSAPAAAPSASPPTVRDGASTDVDELCAQCAPRDFKNFRPHPVSYKVTGLSLDMTRPLAEFQASPRCPFCRLIVKIACSGGLTDPPGTVTIYGMNGFTEGERGWIFRVADELQGVLHRSSAPVGFGIRMMHHSASAPQGDGLLLGRPVRDQVDHDLLSRWLKSCVENHGYRSHSSIKVSLKPLVDLGIRLFVVDVSQHCVTRLPDSSEYATLSYVWGQGGRGQLEWRRTTWDRLHTPGGLDAASEGDIPTTIRDAMALCARLNIRYLWVDALCIPQDDPDPQRQYMDEMASIYHHSLVTIIAASGSTSWAGLPGLRLGSRRIVQHEETVRGITLTSTCRGLDEVITTCPWGRRAWTLQEAVFARRLLIFSDDQVFFRCANGVLYEDAKLEASNPIRVLPWNNVSSTFEWLSDNSPNAPGIGQFVRLVDELNARALTYPGDILRAFAGISRYFSLRYGWNFWHGVPIELLDFCLRFDPTASSRPRVGFPTWSWAGWERTILREGKSILYTHEFQDIVCEVRWQQYVSQGDGWAYSIPGLPHIQTWEVGATEGYAAASPSLSSSASAEDGELAKLRSLWKPTSARYDCIPPPPESVRDKLDGLLVFYTSSVRIEATLQRGDDESVDDAGVIGHKFLPGVDAYRLEVPSSTHPKHCWIFLGSVSSGQHKESNTFECIIVARKWGGRDGGEPDMASNLLQIMVVSTDEHGVSRRVNACIFGVEDAVWASLKPSWKVFFLL